MDIFILSKLFQRLILPGGLVIVFLIFIRWQMKKRKGVRLFWRVFITSGIFVFYLLSIRPVSDLLMYPLEKSYKPYSSKKCYSKKIQAIIVLSSASRNAPDDAPNLQLDPHSLARTLEAYRIWNLCNRKALLVLTGGKDFPPFSISESVALAMKRFLLGLGVPARKILLEDKARDTYENLFYSHKLLLKQNIKFSKESVLVVSSAFHLLRAQKIASKLHLDLKYAPAFFYQSNHPYTWIDFLPGATNLLQSHIALHEYLGLIYYRLRNRI